FGYFESVCVCRFLVLVIPFLFSFSGELYCSLPNPRNVRFESINMKNVLHWSAPEGTGDGVLYKVKYAVVQSSTWPQPCHPKPSLWSGPVLPHCSICHASCTGKEHLSSWNGETCASAEFDCFLYMFIFPAKIDPPMVSVSSTDRSILIILTAPEKWKKSPEEESISLLQVYPGLQYNGKNIFNAFQWFFSISNNTLVVPWLEPGTVYCVSAQIHVTTPLLDSGFSKEHCITTLKDKTEDETIIITFGYIMPTMLALLFTSVACYCVHKYIHIHKQKHPANLVWQYTDKCKEQVFIPSEKIVVNFITVHGDDCKESSRLSERKSPHYNTVYTEGKGLPSEQVLKAKYLLDISCEEISLKGDTLVEGDQTGNWASHGHSESQNTWRDTNAGVVEYEHDVRAEDFSPGQKLEEKFSAPGGLQGEPQIALGDLVDMETGQPYSPQLEIRVADLSLGQKTEELHLKVVDAADEL
ncbi:I20RA protein, partial [Horornis vulcanius]|nr:I20RA protein [Horornis vulcanius]